MDWMKAFAPKPGDENYKQPSLNEAMDILSERRLKFTNYMAGHVARGTLSDGDKAQAEAYLSGIDDANRILRYLAGEGPDIEALDFWKKAKLAQPAEYGVGNMKPKERNKLQLTKPFEGDTIENSQKQLPPGLNYDET